MFYVSLTTEDAIDYNHKLASNLPLMKTEIFNFQSCITLHHAFASVSMYVSEFNLISSKQNCVMTFNLSASRLACVFVPFECKCNFNPFNKVYKTPLGRAAMSH